mmetsp:Transcript_10023/g.9951  ORF Transcript_10023/g.9951 Transcript_10023/m.9951 type:complete len:421 (+) Transcript_10023:125-1387(+)
MKQTVIIDTGSRITAFPCAGCRDCGTHMDSYFDYRNSSSSSVLNCNQNIPCSPCKNDQCGYSQSYAEGSSIAGILVEDFIMFGDDFQHSKRVKFVFGCHNRETNLFRTQKADGIMGLAFAKSRMPTLVDALFSDHDISTDIFAICFGKNDGYMTIGGYNSTLHLSEVMWANLHDDTFYSINWHGLKVDGNNIELSANDFSRQYGTGTIVDSGTTFVYLHQPLYEALWSHFESACSKPGKCDGDKAYIPSEPHMCYNYDSGKYPDIYDFYDTFPVLTLLIDNIEVQWLPENYLFAWPAYPNSYCLGIYNDGQGCNVLGGIFSRGMDVIFDRTTNKIGFADSECNPLHISETHNNRTFYNQTQTSNKTAVEEGNRWIVPAAVVVSGISLGLIGLLIYKITKKCRRKSILEIRDDDSEPGSSV